MYVLEHSTHTSPLLGVYSEQTEVLPDLVEKGVKVQLQLAADDHTVRYSGQPVHLLQAYGVHLIVTL